jgi:hypothetical protein
MRNRLCLCGPVHRAHLNRSMPLSHVSQCLLLIIGIHPLASDYLLLLATLSYGVTSSAGSPWLCHLLLLLQLRSLRNAIDCERYGLARYFSTGSGSFAVKENGTPVLFCRFIFMDISWCDYRASVIHFRIKLEMSCLRAYRCCVIMLCRRPSVLLFSR